MNVGGTEQSEEVGILIKKWIVFAKETVVNFQLI
jgi:hypothetical protein